MRPVSAALFAAGLCGCGFRGYLRPGGLPRGDRIVLIGFTVSRQAVAAASGPAALMSRASIGPADSFLTMFKRMLERGGPFRILADSEVVGQPAYQAIARNYPSRTGFAGDADLYSPSGYLFLTSEPSATLARAVALAVRADAVLWGRVRLELRYETRPMGMRAASIVAAVDVAYFDANGDLAWRDSTFSEGPPGPVAGVIGPSQIGRSATDAFVTAMVRLLERLNAEVQERVGPRAATVRERSQSHAAESRFRISAARVEDRC